jgi:hypothetical protein
MLQDKTCRETFESLTVGEIMNKHTNKSTKNKLTPTHPHLWSQRVVYDAVLSH